ncbi:hypothetical protein ABIE44_003019 [Marmoricola sp. OAE513]|uniref:hypothetical protein n=1 Tax=Marmoricola sp. OAE513 TaxID=2817894 RepID=UPI001AE6238A
MIATKWEHGYLTTSGDQWTWTEFTADAAVTLESGLGVHRAVAALGSSGWEMFQVLRSGSTSTHLFRRSTPTVRDLG